MSEATQVAAPAVTVPATPATPAPAAAAPVVVVPPVQPAAPGAPAVVATDAQGVPEKYAEVKIEGVTLNAEAVGKWGEAAKAAGLSQAQYESAVKFQTEFVKGEIAKYEAQIAEDEKARPSKIMEAVAKDPLLGGKDAVANVATMQRAVEAFGGAEFKAFLDKQQPDTYLQFARFALKVGQAIKEDSSATNDAQAGKAGPWTADDFYRGAQKPNEKPAA